MNGPEHPIHANPGKRTQSANAVELAMPAITATIAAAANLDLRQRGGDGVIGVGVAVTDASAALAHRVVHHVATETEEQVGKSWDGTRVKFLGIWVNGELNWYGQASGE